MIIKLKDLLNEDKIKKEGGPGSGPQGDDEDNPYDKEPSDDDLAAIEKEFDGVNEAIGKGMKWEDLKSGTSIEFTGGTTYVVTKIDKNKLQMSLKRRGKTGGGLFAPKAKLDKSQFESQVKVGLIKYLTNTNPRIKEGKLKEGVEPKGGMAKIAAIVKNKQHGKVGGKTVDMQSANLLMKLYNAVKDKDKEKMNKMNEKKLIVVLHKLWSRVNLKLPV